MVAGPKDSFTRCPASEYTLPDNRPGGKEVCPARLSIAVSVDNDIMRILRIDPFHGASGDMLLAAMLDLGVPEHVVFSELARMLPGEFSVQVRKVMRRNIEATGLTIVENKEAVSRFRNLHDLLALIRKSSLPAARKTDAERCVRNLASAEAGIHGIDVEDVHFHEIGAVDTVIDTVGFMAALDHLEVEEIYVSPVAVGWGVANMEHGEMPLPVPAVLELLKGFQLRHCAGAENMELCTPTGAMLLAGMGRPLAEIPLASPVASGYGAGSHDPPGFANCIRLTLMDVCDLHGTGGGMIQAETVIDDQTPEQLSWAVERIRKAGAVETAITSVMLKKGRTGFLLSMLFHDSVREQVFDVLFRETTTLGVRYYPVERRVLERRTLVRDTPWGKISVKQGVKDGRVVTESPEFEDCARLADAAGAPLKEVFRHATGRGREPDDVL
jgi:uncharacterized protein (TIGR00299 family) protein